MYTVFYENRRRRGHRRRCAIQFYYLSIQLNNIIQTICYNLISVLGVVRGQGNE